MEFEENVEVTETPEEEVETTEETVAEEETVTEEVTTTEDHQDNHYYFLSCNNALELRFLD